MKKRYIILLAIIGTILSIILLDQMHAYISRRNSQAIRIGDTKIDVIKKAGEPRSKFDARKGNTIPEIILLPENETWCYGSYFTFHKPSMSDPIPIRAKWFRFRPDPDELAIEFDATGKVVGITRPPP